MCICAFVVCMEFDDEQPKKFDRHISNWISFVQTISIELIYVIIIIAIIITIVIDDDDDYDDDGCHCQHSCGLIST